MNVTDWGFTPAMEFFCKEQGLENLAFGRVIAEHRERYLLITEQGELEAEVSGHFRYSAVKREEFPAVGDWVAISVYEGGGALIHRLYPRFSFIKRQAAGRSVEVQVIAANINVAFIVMAVDHDFNLNRLERYLTICYTAQVEALVILSKIDLLSESQLENMGNLLKQRHQHIPINFVSNLSGQGLDELKKLLLPGKTYCLLGSSGAGKSSLLNNLIGQKVMQTSNLSAQTGKGRHTTSHRELFFLPNGSFLIDNPGMREVGISDEHDGLEITFNQLHHFAEQCRYNDCTHQTEAGCAVIDALQKGLLDGAAYQNYIKLEKERQFFETTQDERKRKEKIMGKILKDYQKKDYRNKGQ